MDRLRIAVVGLGWWGIKHAEYIAGEEMCELSAVVDPSSAARDYAATHGVPHFETLEALLQHDRPDGVIISTPNVLHVPAGLLCVKAGIPTLIEKPIADTVESALALARASQAAKVPVLIGHHRRHNPIIRRARELVSAGKLGRLTMATSLWAIRKPDSYFDIPWRCRTGAGPILINFIHDVDLLRFLCGEIESVQAITSNAARGFEVENTAVAIFKFANGALGNVVVSDSTVSPWSWEMTSGENPQYPQRDENCYLLAGTEGALAIPKLEHWRYDGIAAWDQPLIRETLDVKGNDPQALQLVHFCQVILGKEEPIVTCEDAAASLAAALALHEAAKSERPVTLNEILERGHESGTR